MLSETIVFIDAGYLSALSKFFGNGKYLKLDILKFANYLAKREGFVCEHVFYYTAPPFQSNNPTEKEALLKAGYDSFVSKIRKQGGITIREGRVQKIGDVFSQKGVDTLITLDLYEKAMEKKHLVLILVSGDTDFVPAIGRVRKIFGTKMCLYYFTDRTRGSIFSLSNHLLKAVDKTVQLDKKDFLDNLYK